MPFISFAAVSFRSEHLSSSFWLKLMPVTCDAWAHFHEVHALRSWSFGFRVFYLRIIASHLPSALLRLWIILVITIVHFVFEPIVFFSSQIQWSLSCWCCSWRSLSAVVLFHSWFNSCSSITGAAQCPTCFPNCRWKNIRTIPVCVNPTFNGQWYERSEVVVLQWIDI